MRRRMRALLLAVGIGVGAVVVGSLSIDEGEVVTLVTRNDAGADQDTALWIVSWNDALYLRASSPRAHWLARLREQPEVTLKRGEATLLFTAIPKDDPQTRAAVNERMAEKYGLADRMWGWLGDRTQSVPILLEPNSGS